MGSEKVVYVNREDPDYRTLRGWADKGMEIVNAPRPLAGQVSWEGPFRHGIFYVASEPGMAALVRGSTLGWDAMDAWPVRLVDNAYIEERVREHLAEAEMTMEDAIEGWGSLAEVARADGWPWYEDVLDRDTESRR